MKNDTHSIIREVKINQQNDAQILEYCNRFDINYDTCLNSILVRGFTECKKIEKEGIDNGI